MTRYDHNKLPTIVPRWNLFKAGIFSLSLLLADTMAVAQEHSETAVIMSNRSDQEKNDAKTNQVHKVVKGTVLEDGNLPMPGVNVWIKGTTQGTITDIDGRYHLEGVQSGDIICFGFIGFKTQEFIVAKTEQSLKDDHELIINVSLTQEYCELLGAVVVEELYTTESNKLKSLWHKVKGIF